MRPGLSPQEREELLESAARGSLRLVAVTDVDPTRLRHAGCGASCTALRV